MSIMPKPFGQNSSVRFKEVYGLKGAISIENVIWWIKRVSVFGSFPLYGVSALRRFHCTILTCTSHQADTMCFATLTPILAYSYHFY